MEWLLDEVLHLTDKCRMRGQKVWFSGHQLRTNQTDRRINVRILKGMHLCKKSGSQEVYMETELKSIFS